MTKRYTVTRCGEEWNNLTALSALSKVRFLRKVYGSGDSPETHIHIWDGDTMVTDYEALAEKRGNQSETS